MGGGRTQHPPPLPKPLVVTIIIMNYNASVLAHTNMEVPSGHNVVLIGGGRVELVSVGVPERVRSVRRPVGEVSFRGRLPFVHGCPPLDAAQRRRRRCHRHHCQRPPDR